MNKVRFFEEGIKERVLKRKQIRDYIIEIIKSEGYVLSDLNIILCDDEYLLKINKKYLKHNYYTDIVTFDYTEQKIINGEIYISVERVRENAKLEKERFLEELKRVIFHGVLHLTGYKDKTLKEKRMMRNKENIYLKLFKMEI
jgi:rRNA maturation RNase YbeY